MRAITVPTLSGDDYSYEAGQLFIWTGAELAMTIVAASIPILRALLSDFVHSKYPRQEPTELETFKKEGDGIWVVKTTTITRSASTASSAAEHGMARGFAEPPLTPLTPLTPDTPGPTYHSFLQK